MCIIVRVAPNFIFVEEKLGHFGFDPVACVRADAEESLPPSMVVKLEDYYRMLVGIIDAQLGETVILSFSYRIFVRL